VNEGTISIDGTNIQDMNLQSLRGLMGLVTQDSILFNDTIKANISLGKPDATDDEIIVALKIANAYEFVNELPKVFILTLETVVTNFLVVKTKAFDRSCCFEKSSIMILDEATSALDTESEKFVQVKI
jgi:subfamily B ATP-binding cassette protein MsbA